MQRLTYEEWLQEVDRAFRFVTGYALGDVGNLFWFAYEQGLSPAKFIDVYFNQTDEDSTEESGNSDYENEPDPARDQESISK